MYIRNTCCYNMQNANDIQKFNSEYLICRKCRLGYQNHDYNVSIEFITKINNFKSPKTAAIAIEIFFNEDNSGNLR